MSACLILFGPGPRFTLIAPVQAWNLFDVLLERDSNRAIRPDLALLSDTQSASLVVGRCLVRKPWSYAGRERHDQARQLFDDLIHRRDFAAIDVDTRWYRAENGLRTPGHFLSVLQRIDLLLTNRLHGMVYALKAGVDWCLSPQAREAISSCREAMISELGEVKRKFPPP